MAGHVVKPGTLPANVTKMMADLAEGDVAETVVPIYVRETEELTSEITATLPEKSKITVLEVGDTNNRAMVSCGDVTGWITTKTELDQVLFRKLIANPDVILCQAVMKMQVREAQDMKSEVLATMDAGSEFELIERGDMNRAKILFEGTVGWITEKTDLDQPLFRIIPTAPKTKIAHKGVDAQMMRMVSNAGQSVTALFSTKQGQTAGGMKSLRSQRGAAAGAAKSQKERPPPVDEQPSFCSKICGR